MDFIARCWFFFRRGYGLYLSFLVGLVSYISVLYFLLVQSLFPTSTPSGFYMFGLILLLIVVPLGVFLGWLDVRRTPMYGTEAEISTEENPYVLRFVPGKERDLQAPISFQVYNWFLRYFEKQGIVSEEEKKRFLKLLQKYESLMKGESLK